MIATSASKNPGCFEYSVRRASAAETSSVCICRSKFFMSSKWLSCINLVL